MRLKRWKSLNHDRFQISDGIESCSNAARARDHPGRCLSVPTGYEGTIRKKSFFAGQRGQATERVVILINEVKR